MSDESIAARVERLSKRSTSCAAVSRAMQRALEADAERLRAVESSSMSVGTAAQRRALRDGVDPDGPQRVPQHRRALLAVASRGHRAHARRLFSRARCHPLPRIGDIVTDPEQSNRFREPSNAHRGILMTLFITVRKVAARASSTRSARRHRRASRKSVHRQARQLMDHHESGGPPTPESPHLRRDYERATALRSS